MVPHRCGYAGQHGPAAYPGFVPGEVPFGDWVSKGEDIRPESYVRWAQGHKRPGLGSADVRAESDAAGGVMVKMQTVRFIRLLQWLLLMLISLLSPTLWLIIQKVSSVDGPLYGFLV